ncbi:hypothetical protein BGZ73_002736 [Actinomortierella ambigua]|nr:hypothetical protein BGZ73_002736 [Actinomortierella ambigua]
MAGHQLRQSTASTFPTKHESILHHALHLYKTLSNLQHSHDIVLIPARHVRSLFLAVSRQEKTSAHLSHVLRLASDLIWLRSRHHQHQYGSIQDDKISCAKPGEAASPAEDIGTTTSDLTRPEQQDRTQWPLPGLLVSEYTILMDWIGAFPANHETLQQQPWAHPTASNLGNRVPSPSTPSPLSPSRSDSGSHDRKGSLNTLAPSTPSLSSCTSHVTLQTKKGKNDMASSSNKSNHRGPPNLAVDRVWAIWQAFQATGMKPDIVLLTTLMHVLSKAQQFDKADQIWETMMALNQAPPPQEQQQHLRQLQDHTDDPHLRKGLHRLARQHGGGGGSGGPNLETFSVLLQAYVAKNDVDGVAGVYQAIRRQQQQQSQSPRSLSKAADTSATASRLYGPSLRDVNTVLLNQILRLLVNVGEHKAAREIFDEMKESASWPMTGAEKEKKEKRKEEEEEGQMRDEKTRRDRRTGTDKSGDGAMAYTALSDLHQHHDPHHHATFARRAYWRANKMQRVQEWKRRKEQQAHPQKDEEEETLHPAYRAGRTGPDTHTVEIMLQLARKDGDAAFENMLQEWLEMHGHL